MRKFIIDTDTASDDAAALMLAALSPDVEILGVTTLTGNVDIEQSARNALATLEACGSTVPVYKGALRPLFREREETISIHGADGMGDCDVIHPNGAAQDKRFKAPAALAKGRYSFRRVRNNLPVGLELRSRRRNSFYGQRARQF